MTILTIDTRTRELKVASVSVTKTEMGLVLRKGAEIGCLKDVCAGLVGKDYWYLILGSGYQAQSSAGFVRLMVESFFDSTPAIVGACGFGRTPTEGNSLRATSFSWKGKLVFGKIRKLDLRIESNVAATAAAIEGLKILARVPGQNVIVEGQSDRLSAWAISASKAEIPEFPLEHRAEMFTSEKLVEAAFRTFVRRSRWEGCTETWEESQTRCKDVLIRAAFHGDETPWNQIAPRLPNGVTVEQAAKILLSSREEVPR